MPINLLYSNGLVGGSLLQQPSRNKTMETTNNANNQNNATWNELSLEAQVKLIRAHMLRTFDTTPDLKKDLEWMAPALDSYSLAGLYNSYQIAFSTKDIALEDVEEELVKYGVLPS